MNLLILKCLLVSLLMYFVSSQEDVIYDVQWISSIPLSEYLGYYSVNLVSVNVPEGTVESAWDIQVVAKSVDECPHRKAQVYFQYGSYPLVSPYNETYPDNFYVKRTELHYVEVTSNNISHVHDIFSPLAGTWFMASFLFKENEKMGVKGLNDKDCSYAASLRLISKVLTNIPEISVNISNTIEISRVVPVFKKFYLPTYTTAFKIEVSRCGFTQQNFDSVNGTESTTQNDICPFNISIASKTIPTPGKSYSVDCSNSNKGCSLFIQQVPVDRIHYLRVDMSENFNGTVNFQLQFLLSSCEVNNAQSISSKKRMMNPDRMMEAEIPLSCVSGGNTTHESSQSETVVLYNNTIDHVCVNSTTFQSDILRSVNNSEKCLVLQSMGDLTIAAKDFSTMFSFPDIFLFPQRQNRIFVPDNLVLVSSFEINNVRDSGGTLNLEMEISNELDVAQPQPINHAQTTKVYICLMKEVIPHESVVTTCPGGILLTANSTNPDFLKSKKYVPYPEQGKWYIGFQSQCFDKNSNASTPNVCQYFPLVKIRVYLNQCVEGECGTYGECQAYISGLFVFSACKCTAGWRGFGCTDGSEADSDASLMTAVMLLTLSNLFFLPGIFVALYRRYFVEALVYFFNMFFSTFYHACDTTSFLHRYCMVKYDVLSICDFYGSILSFWVTIMAMAKIDTQLRSFFHMFGSLVILVVVQYDRHNLWAFLGPVLFGVVVLILSWILQCKKRKQCFPSNKRYIILAFGVILAVVGLITFAFLETENNYQYTHSVWHTVISLSIIFLLPSRRKNSVSKTYMKLQQRSQETLKSTRTDDDDDSLLSDLFEENGDDQSHDRNIIL